MALMNRITKAKPKSMTTEEKKKRISEGKLVDIAVSLGLVISQKKIVNQDNEYISAMVAKGVHLDHRLGLIGFGGDLAKNFQEEVEQHKKIVALLRTKLNDFSIGVSPDTRKLDALLYCLCDRLQKAYDKGDGWSAIYILSTLNYCILRGHKPLLEDEKADSDEIVQQRMGILESFLHICDLSEELYDLKIVMDTMPESYKKGITERNQYRKDIKDFEQANVAHMASIKAAIQSGGHRKNWEDAALQYAKLLRKFAYKHQEVEEARRKLALAEVSMEAVLTEKQMILPQLDAVNQECVEELKDYVRELSNEVLMLLDWQFEDMKGLENVLGMCFKYIERMPWESERGVDRYERIQRMLDEEEMEYSGS